MNELDDLLNELEGTTKPAAPASKASSRSGGSVSDDLDSLLNELAGDSKPSAQTSKAPAAAPGPSKAKTGGDDLDSLLADLGASPAPTAAPKATAGAPASKTSGADDLDSLLNDLAGPAKPAQPKVAPAPAQAKVVQAKTVAAQPKAASAPPAKSSGDDLDALLADLSGTPAPASAKATPAAAQPKAPAKSGDDLDDLLADLSGAPKPAQAKVVQAKVVTAQPKVAPATQPKVPPAQPKASAPKPAAGDDLDDLLADLSGSKPAPATAKVAPAAQPKAAAPKPASSGDDLDALLADLSGSKPAPAKSPAPAPAKVAPAAQPKAAAPKASGGDDLDDLLADLSGSKPAPAKAPAKAAAPPPAAKSGSDLDDLLNDLAGASKPKQPAPAKQAPPPKKEESLDELMASLSVGGSAPAPPKPAKQADPLDDMLQALSSNSGSSKTNVKKGDDLDDLMATLTANSGTTTAAPAVPKPASKTDDLDDMLNTLQSSSGPRPPVPSMGPLPPTGAQPKGRSRFDTLLSTVQSEMTDINKAPARSRGLCHHCRQPIFGDAIQAMGRTYHIEHWLCGGCGNPLGNGSFYEAEGQPMCERCYQLRYCPRCAHCNQAIVDRCVTALNAKWHVQCFVCTQCMQPFSSTFYERDGRPYCENCFYQVFAARCKACNQAILGDCINALGSSWHPEHFNCTTCHKSFAGGPFYEFEGMPYCEIHYHMNLGVSCAGCNQPITGASIDALGKKWHPEHFVCAFCMHSLSGQPYSEKNGKPYCKPCFGKLFQ